MISKRSHLFLSARCTFLQIDFLSNYSALNRDLIHIVRNHKQSRNVHPGHLLGNFCIHLNF